MQLTIIGNVFRIRKGCVTANMAERKPHDSAILVERYCRLITSTHA